MSVLFYSVGLGLAAIMALADGGADAGGATTQAIATPAESEATPPPPAGSPMTWPKGTSPRLVWTGFEMTGEGSRLFLQTSADVEVQVRTGKEGLTVTLPNCRLHLRNGGRPLDTSFFATPVKRVSIHQRRRDIEVHIDLREAADSTPRKQGGPNGSQFWIFDFPPPKASKAP